MNSISLDKSQNRIGTMFNRVAHVYDFLNHLLSAGLDLYWRRRATKELNNALSKELGIVADIATGTGDLAFSLLSSNTSSSVVGVDIAEKMLKEAIKKIENRRLKKKFSIVLGDALKLPLRDSSCNGVMIAFGVRNLPNVELAFSEFFRVLKNKGYVLILEFSIPKIFLFREIYLFYFQKILPRLGQLVSKDDEAYYYLPVSVENFISPADMESYLKAQGFEVLKTHLFLWGVSYFILARCNKDKTYDEAKL